MFNVQWLELRSFNHVNCIIQHHDWMTGWMICWLNDKYGTNIIIIKSSQKWYVNISKKKLGLKKKFNARYGVKCRWRGLVTLCLPVSYVGGSVSSSSIRLKYYILKLQTHWCIDFHALWNPIEQKVIGWTEQDSGKVRTADGGKSKTDEMKHSHKRTHGRSNCRLAKENVHCWAFLNKH